MSVGVRLADSAHKLGDLVQTNVTERNGGITAVEQMLDALTLAESCKSAVLPVNRADVACDLLECFVTAHKSLKAKLESLVKELPELLLVAPCDNTDLRKIDRNDTLIEASLELVAAVLVLPGRKERSASHRAEYVALVMLAHLLG